MVKFYISLSFSTPPVFLFCALGSLASLTVVLGGCGSGVCVNMVLSGGRTCLREAGVFVFDQIVWGCRK